MAHTWVGWFALIGAVAMACGSEEPGEPQAPADGEGDAPVEVSIEGRGDTMGARAVLSVKQDQEDVSLTIIGDEGDTDFVYIDLTFHGVDNTMGAHALEIGLPAQAEHVANLNIAGAQYYSQGGGIDVTLSPEGGIEGSFDFAMAPDATANGPAGAPPVFEPVEDETLISGSFSGSWRLSCQSRLPGHAVYVVGGVYCDSLSF